MTFRAPWPIGQLPEAASAWTRCSENCTSRAPPGTAPRALGSNPSTPFGQVIDRPRVAQGLERFDLESGARDGRIDDERRLSIVRGRHHRPARSR